MTEITGLLRSWSGGDDAALEALTPLVYDELHRIAQRLFVTEGSGHTLQPTALVHEVYLRLGGDKDAHWESKAHFMRVAATTMRRVLIDHSRRKRAAKKGGDRTREPLDKAVEAMEKASYDLLAVAVTDEAGRWLRKPDLCRALETHYEHTREECYRGHVEKDRCAFADREGDSLGPI